VRTVEVPAQRLSRWLAGFAERHGAVEYAATATEMALTGADGARAWVRVPFPPLPPGADLVAHATRERTVGVLLVRRGGYAAGVFDGARLRASKVGSSYVQGTTKAGGWSQQRFARRRANQARAAFEAAAGAAAAVLLPAADGLYGLVTGGDRAAIGAVLDDPRLAALRGLVTELFLPVPDPRLRVLQATPEQFTSVQIRLDP
jgi:Actinobacteria/chloroflexi VLRF1 release factor